MLSTTYSNTKRIKQLIFRGRSIFIYIYTLIKPGLYLKFWNNFTRYLCCFTSSSDTALKFEKEIWDRNHLTPTSLDFFLKKPFFLEKCRSKLKTSCFAFCLSNQPQKELNKSSLKTFPFSFSCKHSLEHVNRRTNNASSLHIHLKSKKL